jgi:leucyl aminopeptidase
MDLDRRARHEMLVSDFDPDRIYLEEGAADPGTPIWLLGNGPDAAALQQLLEPQRRWLEAVRFAGAAKKIALLPDEDCRLGGVVLGLGNGVCGEPSGRSELLIGQLPLSLPPGAYHLAGTGEPELAALAWGLGAYRYGRYKNGNGANGEPARLRVPEGVDRSALINTVEAVWLGRDLINTPASDLGPAEIEAAVRVLGARHGASVASTVGEDLLSANLPMIHAVGRASTRAPRLIDLTWGRAGAPTITVIGKGISFDTGGLDIKPSSAMLLMKKDMGGAAAALALGHMIMGQGLDVRLRILIPSAENAISGEAFRPGDVLRSRLGKTVEVGNTDAEGRLVLADALALADEEAPDTLITFATLTGAARVALGPDLPALFTEDEVFASAVAAAGASIGDPVWRLPLWPGYERYLDSEVADMSNVAEAPFAGAVTAALFLRRFVSRARRFAHFDIYGWRPAARPLGPKGGEPQVARAVFRTLKEEIGAP